MVIIKKTNKMKKNNINKTKHNIFKHKKLNKNKSKYKNNKKYKNTIQKGGERSASSIDEFMELINKEEKLDIEIAKEKLTKFKFNKYYSILIKYIPCSIRIRDSTNKQSIKKFYFTKKFEKIKEESYNNERFAIFKNKNNDKFNPYLDWGTNDLIRCYTTNEGYELQIPNPLPLLNDCNIQVQLMTIGTKQSKKSEHEESDHALVLLINNKDKTFSILDPNGIGITINNLNDKILQNMLVQVLIGYKHKNIYFPACQRNSYAWEGSCVVWSQLFIELILRFGLDTAKNYLDKLIVSSFNYSDIILKYANYIYKCLDNMSYIIKDSNFIIAEELHSLITEANNKILSTENLKPTLYKQPVIENGHFLIIFGIDNSNWILLYSKEKYNKPEWNWKNTYIIKSEDFDIQKLSTIVKNDKRYTENEGRTKDFTYDTKPDTNGVYQVQWKYGEVKNTDVKMLQFSLKSPNLITTKTHVKMMDKKEPLISVFFQKKGYTTN
jgi:hypothetical protein